MIVKLDTHGAQTVLGGPGIYQDGWQRRPRDIVVRWRCDAMGVVVLCTRGCHFHRKSQRRGGTVNGDGHIAFSSDPQPVIKSASQRSGTAKRLRSRRGAHTQTGQKTALCQHCQTLTSQALPACLHHSRLFPCGPRCHRNILNEAPVRHPLRVCGSRVHPNGNCITTAISCASRQI
jgi:hypothetical protein